MSNQARNPNGQYPGFWRPPGGLGADRLGLRLFGFVSVFGLRDSGFPSYYSNIDENSLGWVNYQDYQNVKIP